MKRRTFVKSVAPLLAGAFASHAFAQATTARAPRATVAEGVMEGEWQGQVAVFRGVPYARAERFQPPVAIQKWSGVRRCVERGAMAPQLPSRMDEYIGTTRPRLDMSEACQHLTINSRSLSGKKPVMVFIHGGAYVTGSGEDARYDSHRLALDGDVVTVNMSYRLGVLGYAYLPDLGAVNLGLQDQAAALKWIRTNIAAFGGDPENITVFGQSAGAHSIACLLATPDAPIFRRAILQSGPLSATLSQADAKRAAEDFIATLGGDPQKASLEAILKAQAAASPRTGRSMPFSPVVAGFAPMSRPLSRGVDLLVGWNRDDASPFIAFQSGKALADYGPEQRALADVATEVRFAAPSRTFARLWSAAGARVTTYRFDWQPAGAPLGAGHCLELSLLLGSPQDWEGVFMIGNATQEEIAQLGGHMRKAWGEFARSGIPPARQSWMTVPVDG